MACYGMTAHPPVTEARFLYDDEIAAGLDLDARFAQFEVFASFSRQMVAAYSDRLNLLRGFEAEVVPSASYAADTLYLRDHYGFDYVVGSVHWVDEMPIDVSQTLFDDAVERLGGLESLLVRYYELVSEMIQTTEPEVVGHFDLPRLFSEGHEAHNSNLVLLAVDDALELAAEHGSWIEINTAGLRKGLRGPYPAAPVVRRARDLGVQFTFGDDSHHVDHVAAGIEQARAHLLAQGVRTIGSLQRGSVGGAIVREQIPLL